MRLDRTRRLLGVASGILLSTVSQASAAESGEHPTLFTGDLGNIIWSLLTFVVVLAVLGKFAWGPILRALQKREDFIRDSLDQAKKDRQDAQARLGEYTEKLDSARAEGTAIVQEARRGAEDVKRKIEEEARAEGAAMVERAKREIGVATDTAIKELYSLTARLSTDVASRIIRKELDPKEHQRLIAESIEELQMLSHDGRDKN